MRILAIDSASVSGSAAIWERTLSGERAEERLVAQSYLRCGLTHSETLLPQVEQLLSWTGLSLTSFDCVAVTVGPGSFTGVRIGVAAAAGLALAADLRCCGVSTLEAAAGGLRFLDARVRAVMDARREQVYTALFAAWGGRLARLSEDEALPVRALGKDGGDEAAFLVGDGALLTARTLGEGHGYRLVPDALCYPSACNVAALAGERQGEWIPPEALRPVYLRAPQAERERQERDAKAGG